MLSYITGEISYLSPTEVVLDYNGMGLRCQISLHTYSAINQLKKCKLHIHMYFKHEGQNLSALDLYGFYTGEELKLFEMLISISGIGANTARMMFSSLNPKEIRHAIVTEDEKTVQSIKGIGPKSAKRIILELKDKLEKSGNTEEIPLSTGNTNLNEALQALVSLGFQKNNAEKALKLIMQRSQTASLTVEELIKQTLKTL